MNSQVKLLLLVLGAFYAIYHFSTASSGDWHFIDNVDLVLHEAGHVVFLHEAGHVVFLPFGRFMAVLGGSLLQAIIPLLFSWYFWRSSQKFSAAAMLLWLAVNLFYVAVYAGDAIAMQLPLLGGEASTHDWNYLLLETGLIAQAPTVAKVINFLGLLSVAAALHLGWRQVSQASKP